MKNMNYHQEIRETKVRTTSTMEETKGLVQGKDKGDTTYCFILIIGLPIICDMILQWILVMD